MATAGALAGLVLVAVPVGLVLQPEPSADRLLSGEPAVESSPPVEPTASPVPAQPCPATLTTAELAVPAPPPPAMTESLVPDEAPLAASVCRYSDAALVGSGQSAEPPPEVGLEAQRELAGGLARLPADLALPAGSSPGVCTAIGGPVISYLVQLRYASTTVWLRTNSDLNSCQLVTNGSFTSGVYVGGQVEASYEAGSWVPEPPHRLGQPTPCPRTPTGRAGQGRSLVPTGWDELVVCRSTGGAQTADRLDDEQARQVVDLLLSLNTRASAEFGASCDEQHQVAGHDERTQTSLIFGYPRGRSVLVIPFVGCDPPIGNGSLEATATAEQQAELLRLLEEG